MPPEYGLMVQTDVWLPYAENAEYWQSGDNREYIAMGRIKRGVSLAQAQAEMSTIAQRQAAASPANHTGWTIHLRPLAIQVVGKTRPILFVLLGAVGFVLLIACANVANLQLCRSSARRREMAVRAAIGAGRIRIMRQLLTESVLLSVVGGAVGLAFGAWGIRVILALSPSNVSRLNETTLDGRVLLFTVFASLATGVLFGLAPAWNASRINLNEALNAGGRSGVESGRHRTHGLWVAAEVALAVMLLTGAGLMVQSFVRLQAVDLGFKPQRVAAFDVGLHGARYDGGARKRQFYREARERLGKLPGIRAVAAISNLPMGGYESYQMLYGEGQAFPRAAGAPNAENRKVTPGYFETMGITLLHGRDFTDRDAAGQLQVCVINETTSRDFFSDAPGADPIGKRLKLGGTDENNPWFTVGGVARDVRGHALDKKPGPQVYRPVEQDTDNQMTFVVRAETMSTESLERAVRAEMKSIDAALPLANFRTMESLVANAVARPRFSTFLISLFALTALLLTVVGLYGVVAYTASQRTREIGIRMALGASGRSVLRLVIRQGMSPAVIGLVTGVAEELQPAVYRLHEQADQTGDQPSGIVVRTSVDPASIIPAVRQAIWSVDKNQPVARVQTIEDIVARQLSSPSQNSALLSAFALLALLLASLGLYGVLSYAVTHRTNEIGVRMALGATANDILLSFGRRGLKLTLAGLALGLVLAVIAARLMTTLFYGFRPDYIPTVAGVSLVLLAVAALACFVPARRASKIDPMEALRHD